MSLGFMVITKMPQWFLSLTHLPPPTFSTCCRAHVSEDKFQPFQPLPLTSLRLSPHTVTMFPLKHSATHLKRPCIPKLTLGQAVRTRVPSWILSVRGRSVASWFLTFQTFRVKAALWVCSLHSWVSISLELKRSRGRLFSLSWLS